MKKVLSIFSISTVVVFAIFFAIVQATIAQSSTPDITLLPGKGRATTDAFLVKGSDVLVISFSFIVGNDDQETYYNGIFRDIYSSLEEDGWEPESYHNKEETSYKISINVNYEEDGKVLGILVSRNYDRKVLDDGRGSSWGSLNVLVPHHEGKMNISSAMEIFEELEGVFSPAGN